MPILERFSTLFPGVRVSVRMENSSRLLKLVAEHRVDLALVTLTSAQPDFLCEHLVDQEVLIIVNETHAWWNRKCISVHELTDQAIVLREEGSMTRQLFERGLAKVSVNVAPRLVLASREAVKEAAAAGIGAGIVLSRELGFDPRLRGIPVEGADLSAGEYVVALPELGEIGAVREFLNIARDMQ
jgi:DNA-binding transcriptional LysR family regulator